MPDSCTGESILVERAVAGDADAFGELYMMHLDAIYRYVYYRVGDDDDAEDLTEQVFLQAWQALPGYEQRGYPFTSWLYRIAHNKVSDHHRARAAYKAPLPLGQLSGGQLSGGDGVCQSRQQAALDRVISAEEAEALSAAIGQLGDDQQQVIILRFIEGLSHAEVADIMNKSPGACRVIQHRALAALNQLLTDARPDERPADSRPEVQRAKAY
jgi:RNA polymerase sigma-70 factor (ECF subfamily)